MKQPVCDNFDHLSITHIQPVLIQVALLTLSPPRKMQQVTLYPISPFLLYDCGSIDNTGKYTAPFVEQTTFCTVSVTSDCGGEATSTDQVYGDWVDAQPEPDCNLSLKVLEPTKDSQYLIGDNLNIIFTPKDSELSTMVMRLDMILCSLSTKVKPGRLSPKPKKILTFPTKKVTKV